MSYLGAFLLVLLVSCVSVQAAEPGASQAAKPYLGCWQGEKDKEILLLLEPTRCVKRERGMVWAEAVRYGMGKISFGLEPLVETAEVSLSAGKLTLKKGQEEVVYVSLAPVPEQLCLKPIPFGSATPSAVKIREIQDELGKRYAEGKSFRKGPKSLADPKLMEEMFRVDKGNTAYLTALVKEFGWIDAGRFGEKTSGYAFMLVQHSGELPLMQSALPAIEKDTRAGLLKDASSYALLHDRLALRLGGKQRYGSQVGRDAGGETIVLPLENPAKVDEFRKEIGIMPLAEYLSAWERHTGKKIKIPTE